METISNKNNYKYEKYDEINKLHQKEICVAIIPSSRIINSTSKKS